MTSKQLERAKNLEVSECFPEFPPRDDMQNPLHLYVPGYLTSLNLHFGDSENNLILSEVPLGHRPRQRAGILIPDLMVAFDVDVAMVIAQRGYALDTHGRPPDFVLEVASPNTARNDEGRKRLGYQAYGVPEYWRFDPSGGRWHHQALAGDRLVDGEYRPITIESDGERHWGYSEALGLTVCWEAEKLRWWDRGGERYLATHSEEAQGRAAAEMSLLAERQARMSERQAAEATLLSERQAHSSERRFAEERIRQLEEELARMRQTEDSE